MYIAPIFPLDFWNQASDQLDLLQTTSYWSHFLSHATLYLHSLQDDWIFIESSTVKEETTLLSNLVIHIAHLSMLYI